MKTLILATLAVGALCLSACQSQPTENKGAHAQVKPAAKPVGDKIGGKKDGTMEDIGNRGHVLMSWQNKKRSAKDKALDEARKPIQVLEFSEIWPGMTVLELEAGTGYYTELLDHLVGEDLGSDQHAGLVYMQNPPAFDKFLTPEKMEPRLGKDGKRLKHTKVLRAEFNALGLPDESVDIVTWILGPHELFYVPEGTKGFGDPDKTYAEIYRVLKPGGRFMVLDHVAKAGAPESVGGDLHRIDPQSVKARAEKAGFRLEKTSKVLANPDDDHSKNVFDPSIRRHTDRFLHMYKKPKT